jgi:hypothetical protein
MWSSVRNSPINSRTLLTRRPLLHVTADITYIDDQQVGPAEAGEQLGVAAVAAGQVEGGEESGAR